MKITKAKTFKYMTNNVPSFNPHYDERREPPERLMSQKVQPLHKCINLWNHWFVYCRLHDTLREMAARFLVLLNRILLFFKIYLTESDSVWIC